MNPFDVINDISLKKAGLITGDNEKDYNPFLTNRGLSYFPDTIFHAQEMNKLHHLDKKLQYDYLFNSIRKSKRFSKWSKKDNIKDIDAIIEYFGYSRRRAEEVLNILDKEQVKSIKKKLDKGGVAKDAE
ncbi:clamp loader small subunit [uncultured Caudovirales phage]|uniref:Clamp loader small subunit n=1 Tax=uncultured Caudovirales phage TaxID=2100421 RepID=A0A6J5QD20_9CAUD|nr:clamp loader small subunit [uncultured Caudovirales phage]